MDGACSSQPLANNNLYEERRAQTQKEVSLDKPPHSTAPSNKEVTQTKTKTNKQSPMFPAFLPCDY
jgi:hypothetical protein